MDPPTLCRLSSSCEEARQTGPNSYEGRIAARALMITLKARVEGTIVEIHEPAMMRVAITGESTGLPGTFRGQATLRLSNMGDSSQGTYHVEVDLLGRLGSLGKPFFQFTAQKLATKFAGKVSAHLSKRT